jgi:hypothetical protein
MKTITIVLEDMRNTNSDPTASFRVKKAVNTVQYPIGSYLPKSSVSELCKTPGYTVNIIEKS